MDFNATSAYIRAGYSENGAGQGAHILLNTIEVKAAIDEQKRRLAALAEATASLVLREWLDIATADPSELTHTRVYCCRFCYGIDHKYHWTQSEYSHALNVALATDKPVPDIEGGFGFDAMREPHQGCPSCQGHGISRVWIADTRKLSPKARRLFAGVKHTKDGIEIKMRDQDAAWAKIADYLGMSNKSKAELSGPGGGPIPLANATPVDLTDAQLEALAAAGMAQIPPTVDNLGVSLGVYSSSDESKTIEATF